MLRSGTNVLHMEHVTQTSRNISRVVERRLRESSTSLRAASRNTGIPLTTLGRRLTGNSPFSMSELAMVADLLGTTVSALVIEAESAA